MALFNGSDFSRFKQEQQKELMKFKDLHLVFEEQDHRKGMLMLLLLLLLLAVLILSF